MKPISPDWFTKAALDRIALCAAQGDPWEAHFADEIVMNYLKSRPAVGLANIWVGEGDLLGTDRTMPDRRGRERSDAAAMRLYSLVGLVELAVRAGYADLSQWPGRGVLGLAIRRLIAREAASDRPTDLTLARELLARLKGGQLRVAQRDAQAFGAFSSYLHLTLDLNRDINCRMFIGLTARVASYSHDLAFLVTPQHFAKDLAEIRDRPAAIGLRALGYLRRLTEILHRAEHDSDLCIRIIRHARWSHAAPRLVDRITMWGWRLAEWEEVSGFDHPDNEWTSEIDALRPSHRDLEAIGEDALPIRSAEIVDRVLPDPEQLVAEGRLGAARQVLRHQARLTAGRLHAEQPSWAEDPEQWRIVGEAPASFARICQDMVRLGDVDAAAAICAPHVDWYVSEFGVQNPNTQTLLKILAHSRLSAENPPVDPIASPVNPPTSQAAADGTVHEQDSASVASSETVRDQAVPATLRISTDEAGGA